MVGGVEGLIRAFQCFLVTEKNGWSPASDLEMESVPETGNSSGIMLMTSLEIAEALSEDVDL